MPLLIDPQVPQAPPDPQVNPEPLPQLPEGPFLEPPESQRKLTPGVTPPGGRPAAQDERSRWFHRGDSNEPRMLPGLTLPKLGTTPGWGAGFLKNHRQAPGSAATEAAVPQPEAEYSPIPQRRDPGRQPVALGTPDDREHLHGGHTPPVPPAEDDEYEPLPVLRNDAAGPRNPFPPRESRLPLTPQQPPDESLEQLPPATAAELHGPAADSEELPAAGPEGEDSEGEDGDSSAGVGPSFFPSPAPFGQATQPPADLPAATQTGASRQAPAPLSNVIPSAARQDESRSDQFSLAAVTVCESISGFREIVPANSRALAAGQQLHVYAELSNFRTDSIPEGFRTQTYSIVEICAPNGKVLYRQPLGNAADISVTEPEIYCLNHQLVLPQQLLPGEYVLGLQVYDLIGRQMARSEISFAVR
jgi:hypothetical protein